jgi:hypothetical protein
MLRVHLPDSLKLNLTLRVKDEILPVIFVLLAATHKTAARTCLQGSVYGLQG